MDRISQSHPNRFVRLIKKSFQYCMGYFGIERTSASIQDIPDVEAIREIVGDQVDLEIQHLQVYVLGKPLFLRGKPVPSNYLARRPLDLSDLHLLSQPIFFTLKAAMEYCRFRREPMGVYYLHVPETAILGDNTGLRIALSRVNNHAIERVYPAIQHSKTSLENPEFNQDF